MTSRLILLVGAYLAEIAGTIAGFGSSSIFLPIASQIMSFQSALLLVAIYHIFGNMSRLSMFYKHWNKKIFLLFGIPSILGTVIGAGLAGIIDPNTLKMALGIVLAIFACYSLLRPVINLQSRPWLGRVGGACSGFTAGLIGTGGVLRGAFMSLFKLPKEQYIATIASIALLVDVTRIPIYFGQGFVDKQYIWLVPILFMLAFLGSWTGKLIVKHIPAKVFRKIILVCVIIGALLLFLQGANII